MAQPNDSPKVQAGGLVTVAYLKARLDEGDDHLGIFMPLLFDALAQFGTESFTTADVQEAIANRHGVAMPQQTVATLLKRSANRKLIVRESGRYRRNTRSDLPSINVEAKKAGIQEQEQRLGDALRTYADSRGFTIDSTNTALEKLQNFLEVEQVALLLGNPFGKAGVADDATGKREHLLVAEFLQNVLAAPSETRDAVRAMLEGMVLYHAAFLPDLNSTARRFKDLRVIFDSVLVRQALGYEGTAMATLMRETMSVLKGSEVQCLVLDKSLEEIRRILSMYEVKLATADGRTSLKQVPMARHFLTKRYTPSDVREMSALLEQEVTDIGFRVIRAPRHQNEFTAGEKALAIRLTDKFKRDELEPRVVHDVDCVAAALTLRKGHRSTSIDDARAVFATSSPLVIINSRTWWKEDEREVGIEPVVHIRALSNLAWLKKPSLCTDFKMRELVALCGAALRPSQGTWDKFRRHLDALEKSKKLTSNEVTAVLVSAMSDQLLREVEFTSDDPNDIDATTLDDVVDRVTATYKANAAQRIQQLSSSYEGQLEEYAERERRREVKIEKRASSLAHWVVTPARWALSLLVLTGGVALIVGHGLHGGVVGVLIGVAIIAFVVCESVGILHHVSGWAASLEEIIKRRVREWY